MMKTGMAAIAALMAITPTLAAANDNPFAADKAVLSLRGLDLTTVDGQQRLAIRMDQAARAVCGDGMSSIHLALEAKSRSCRAGVYADIRARIAVATASASQVNGAQFAAR